MGKTLAFFHVLFFFSFFFIGAVALIRVLIEIRNVQIIIMHINSLAFSVISPHTIPWMQYDHEKEPLKSKHIETSDSENGGILIQGTDACIPAEIVIILRGKKKRKEKSTINFVLI